MIFGVWNVKRCKDDIYYNNTVLEKMENLKKILNNSTDYNNLYQNIISVGKINIKSHEINWKYQVTILDTKIKINKIIIL